MKEETPFQKYNRERRDIHLMIALAGGVDPYPGESTEQCISLRREMFSIRWILYYELCRNAGVSCRYSSSQFANDRLCVISGYDSVHEFHKTPTEYMERLILYRALKHRIANGYCKPKAVPVEEQKELQPA